VEAKVGALAIGDLKVDSIRPRTWEDCRDIACAVGGPNPALPPSAAYSNGHSKLVIADPVLASLAPYTTLYATAWPTILSSWSGSPAQLVGRLRQYRSPGRVAIFHRPVSRVPNSHFDRALDEWTWIKDRLRNFNRIKDGHNCYCAGYSCQEPTTIIIFDRYVITDRTCDPSVENAKRRPAVHVEPCYPKKKNRRDSSSYVSGPLNGTFCPKVNRVAAMIIKAIISWAK
jgi:hypothetical protein